jgi:Zn-dependent protease with chaperone function
VAEAALGLLVLAALVAPHPIALDRATPARAAAVWMAVLLLRATLVVGSAVLVLVLVPSTALYEALSQTTWHRPVPLLGWHPDLPIDLVAHTAVLLPAAALVAALAAYAARRLWAARRLRTEIEGCALGEGPKRSLVVADERILVGVPGVGPGRIVVSDAALAALDPQELDATLAHELGHLRRRHRALRLAGSGLAQAARLLPGTRPAEAGLRLSLERDADDYAVRTTGDPLGLASAICKVARTRSAAGLIGLDGAAVTARLDHLLAGGRLPISAGFDRAVLALAAGLGLASAAVVGGLAVLVGARLDVLALAVACSP